MEKEINILDTLRNEGINTQVIKKAGTSTFTEIIKNTEKTKNFVNFMDEIAKTGNVSTVRNGIEYQNSIEFLNKVITAHGFKFRILKPNDVTTLKNSLQSVGYKNKYIGNREENRDFKYYVNKTKGD